MKLDLLDLISFQHNVVGKSCKVQLEASSHHLRGQNSLTATEPIFQAELLETFSVLYLISGRVYFIIEMYVPRISHAVGLKSVNPKTKHTHFVSITLTYLLEKYLPEDTRATHNSIDR